MASSTTASGGWQLRRGIQITKELSRKAFIAPLFLLVFAGALNINGQATSDRDQSGACPFSLTIPAFAGSSATLTRSLPVYKIKIVKEYPHDPGAFTQGLLYLDGFFYESTGIVGRSSIRKVEPETGRIVQQFDLPAPFFGEGLADWEGSLIQITWKSGKGFIYDLGSFSLKREFSYDGEGWGIARCGKSLVMSNGSSKLVFLNPETFVPERSLNVLAGGLPVLHLNELECLNDEILANVWLTEVIARISPRTGEVTGWIDLSGLRKTLPAGTRAEALNGIAWDAKKGRLYVTGKYWPKVFQVEIVD